MGNSFIRTLKSFLLASERYFNFGRSTILNRLVGRNGVLLKQGIVGFLVEIPPRVTLIRDFD